MNDKKKQNVIIIAMITIAIVIAGVIIGIAVYNSNKTKQIAIKYPKVEKTQKKNRKQKNSNPYVGGPNDPNSPRAKKYTKQPISNTPPKMQKYLYRMNISKIGVGNKTGDDINIKNRMVDLVTAQQFKTYEKSMKDAINEYKFSKGYGLDVAGLYQDEQNFMDLTHDSTISAKEAGNYFAHNVKTPEGLAILGLYFDQIARGRFILDSSSISPIGFSKLQYHGTSVYNDPNQINAMKGYEGFNAVKQIFNITGQNSVYVVHLSLDDNTHTIPYDAIIGEDNRGKLAILGYYTGSQYMKEITDKPLKYFYEDRFKKQYANAAKNQEEEVHDGNVNVDKLYPWIEKGGPTN